jgi:hypothetical protein
MDLTESSEPHLTRHEQRHHFPVEYRRVSIENRSQRP